MTSHTRPREECEYEIVVLDVNQRRWPSVASLVKSGIPVRIAERYRKERWKITTGLKRRVARDCN